MPLPLAIPVIAAGGTLLARVAGEVGQIAKLVAICLAIMKVYYVVLALWIAFWFVCALFAKEILTWWTGFIMKLVSGAMNAVGMHDAMSQLVDLIEGLPPVILDAYAWLGVFNSVSMMLAALFLNMSLRSIPFIGGMFRS